MLRSIVRLATSAAREEAAVVIPVYRSLVTPEEKISYDRVLTVFKKKPIVLIAPAGLNTAEFARGHERLRVERFDRAWFQSHRGYSRLLLTPGFYERFLPYEYILICQTDAFVFADCLSGWCGRGYDYIGAPWVGLEKEMAQQARDRVLIRRIWPWLHERTNAAVGNGGFSLRRTRAFLASLLALRLSARQWRTNEDLFWSHAVPRPVPKLSPFEIDHKSAA